MAKTGRKLVEVEPEFFQLTEEDSVLEGIYVESESFFYRNGDEGRRYILCDEDDKLKRTSINGNATLNRQMDRVLPGTYVRIEFVGTYETANGTTGKICKVQAEEFVT